MEYVLGYRVSVEDDCVHYFVAHEGHIDPIWSMAIPNFLESGEELLNALLTALKRAELVRDMRRDGLSVAEIDRQMRSILADD